MSFSQWVLAPDTPTLMVVEDATQDKRCVCWHPHPVPPPVSACTRRVWGVV